MPETRAILLITVAVLIALVGVFAFRAKGSQSHFPKYQVLFILGLTWIPIGLVNPDSALWMMGVVFVAVGLANRKKWNH